jgi:pimeloyl-ACP methyl ester carboxylesterase
MGEELPTVLVIPGTEPAHVVPDGLRLQGVRSTFEDLAPLGSVCIAWQRKLTVENTSISDLCDAYEDLVRELELADLTIVGVSTGSLVAIELAFRLGKRCTHLALVAGGASVSEEGRIVIQQTIEHARAGEWREIAGLQMRSFYPGFAGAFYGLVGRLFPALYGTPEDPTHFIALSHAALEADLFHRLPELEPRVLCVSGENDIFFPPDEMHKLALLCPEGESHLIPRAGHGVFKSHASEIHRRIREFVARHSPAS